MKKSSILLSLILVSYSALSQNITRSDVAFEVGQSYEMTPFYINFDPGSDGIGVTWDLSSLPDGVPGLNTNVISDDVSLFPTANTVQSVGIGYRNYLYITDNSMDLVGVDFSGFVRDYTNPHTIMSFPVTNTYYFTDTFEYTAGMHTWEGSFQSEFSGYGTLITPEGTFTDAVRLKETTIQIFSSSAVTVQDTTFAYVWYKAGIHHELAAIQKKRSNTGNSDIVYFTSVGQSILSKEEHSLFDVSISPNPASEMIHINGSQKIDQVKIYDLSGEFILEKSVPGSTKTELDISDLNAGIYLVHIFDKSGYTSVKRISKN